MIISLDGKYSTTHMADHVAPAPGQSHRPGIPGPTAKIGGLRVDGYLKRPYARRAGKCYIGEQPVQAGAARASEAGSNVADGDFPVVTIVTIVYNGAAVLEETILNVLHQTYPNVEYIIVDGGSTDGSLDIIRKYQGAIDFWISEKDGGIYDAMNKAIGLATGTWINFMNAGDLFASPSTLQDVSQLLDDEALGLAYGNHYINFRDGLVLPSFSKSDPHGLLMPFSHQAAIYRCDLLKQYAFDVRYRLAADFDQLNRMLANRIKCKRLDMFVATIESGGASDTQRIQVMKEYSRISGFHPMHAVYIARLLVKAMLGLAIPRPIFTMLERRSRLKRFGSSV